MKTCEQCGSASSDEARFCSSCGAPLSATCPVCGAEVGADDRFCPSCGNRLAEAAEEVDPGEERKLVTVLFSDLTGSTALGERLDPERLKEILTTYFREMRSEIEAEGGTVEKFIGDAVVAVFGVPVAHEDDASRAVRASVRMYRRLESLNRELIKRYDVGLQMRIGINTGQVFAVAAPAPGESMVSGDVVNVAARLEQGARPGTVLVSERTAASARGFLWEPVELATIRGRSAPVQTFLLVGESTGSDRGVPGVTAPMVGRNNELAFLDSVLQRTIAENRSYLVTVYGEPGIGKSRLAAEFVDRAQDVAPHLRSLVGRCLPYGEGVTYWPLAEILKSHCGILDSDPPELALEKIDKVARDLLSADLVGDPRRATAALAYTMGLMNPDFDFRSLSPRQVGNETQGAWSAFFTALAKERPLVVVVEDIHWAEEPLLHLLEELARTVSGSVLFLCPARGELSVRSPTWGGGQRNFAALMLEPLGPDDAALLVESLLSAGGISSQLRDRILRGAEGNPFFLEEIIRKLIDEGAFVRTDTGWHVRASVSDVGIPDTIQATLAARIDLLAPEDKRVLQHAAVVGRVFWEGPLVSLLDLSSDAVEKSLERLGERELVLARFSSSVEGEREYIFKHILTRDVAYESLPRRDRPRTHYRVATWIEQTARQRRGEFVELLAHHYTAAYRGARDDLLEAFTDLETLRQAAVGALLEASSDARARLAIDKAVRLAHDALSIAETALERSLAHEAVGDAYYIDYQGDPAWRAFRAAVDERLKAQPVDGPALAMLCAKAVEIPIRWQGIMTELPDRDEVERYLRLGLSHIDETDSVQRARLLGQVAGRPFGFFYLDISEEELEASVAAGEEAVAIAARLGDAGLESTALDGLDACYMSQGKTQAMLDNGIRRIALVPRIEDPLEIGDIYSMVATAHLNMGNYRQALELSQQGFELTVSDAPTGGLHCLTFATMASFELGDWDGALDTLAKTIAIMGEREMPPMAWMRAWGAAAFIHEAKGNRAEADRLIELLSRVKGPQTGRPGSGAASIAMIYARRKEFDTGMGWLNRLRWAEATPVRAKISCDFTLEAADWMTTHEVVAAARGEAEATGCPVIGIHANRLEGLALAANGDVEGAEALLVNAESGFRKIEAAWEEAVTQLYRAELRASRNQDGARELASAAIDVFARVGSVREHRRARRLLDGSSVD